MTNNPVIQVHAPGAFNATQVLPLRGTPATDGFSAALQVQALGVGVGSGSLAVLDTFDTNTDAIAPVLSEEVLGSVAFLFAYDESTNTFKRARFQSDSSDAIATGNGTLSVMSYGMLFNGAAWDRARSADATNLAAFAGLGAALSANPGEWAIEHRPAVSTQATITRAAGAAGVRHVCRSINASLVAVAAQTIIDVLLRDGATGAGAVLWSTRVSAPAGGNVQISLTGLNIVGSAATAMTLEFSGAPVATNFEGVALTGYDAA